MQLTAVGWGKMRAARPGLSSPDSPVVKTPGHTAPPNLSPRAQDDSFWSQWKPPGPEPEDWCLAEPSWQLLSFQDLNQNLWNHLWGLETKKDFCYRLNNGGQTYPMSLLMHPPGSWWVVNRRWMSLSECAKPRLLVKCFKWSHRLLVLSLSDGDQFWKILFSSRLAEACQASETSALFDLLKPTMFAKSFAPHQD